MKPIEKTKQITLEPRFSKQAWRSSEPGTNGKERREAGGGGVGGWKPLPTLQRPLPPTSAYPIPACLILRQTQTTYTFILTPF